MNITRSLPYGARVRAAIPLSCAAPDQTRTTTEQGKRTMRMFSEKAIAFLLALVMSGTAFNTFIV
ncbi:hypothetical protein OIK40_12820 [Erythrobacter sp. sf7]|uniref:Uncharacterized protein n=1 Tax=Erythrobacter fulvus TaxID=2987523 RepID=A0ABT5JRY2_9SPHN|nr:hypothetical protein [Erythrobacter fulvus]MDC8755525.1 hypothetical protein [Erythrobacter fulvus]